jgi:hypothetical protein
MSIDKLLPNISNGFSMQLSIPSTTHQEVVRLKMFHEYLTDFVFFRNCTVHYEGNTILVQGNPQVSLFRNSKRKAALDNF